MNAAHLHLLVNHLPVVGFAFGLILLAATMLRRGDRGMFAASVLVVVISGAGGLGANFTGEPAEEVVEHLPDVPKDLIETHEGAGLIATALASITTLLAIVLSFATLRKEGRIGVIPLSILLVATMATCGAMTWAGSTGGKIRHSEIRGSTSTAPSPGVRED
jgi:uncharacterized membrane protein